VTFCLGGGAGYRMLFFVGIFFFLQDLLGKWIWKYDLEEDYSVKGVYHLLTQEDHHVRAPLTKFI